jgi:hypothetical protein
MARWRFYQGLRTEWRWYQVDDGGEVVAESDRGFAELQGCMANAETAGFINGEAFHVYTRQAGSFVEKEPAVDDGTDGLQIGSSDTGAKDNQATP